MQNAKRQILRFLSDREEGATMVEYVLMLCFIALALYIVVGQLGNSVNTALNSVNSGFAG